FNATSPLHLVKGRGFSLTGYQKNQPEYPVAKLRFFVGILVGCRHLFVPQSYLSIRKYNENLPKRISRSWFWQIRGLESSVRCQEMVKNRQTYHKLVKK